SDFDGRRMPRVRWSSTSRERAEDEKTAPSRPPRRRPRPYATAGPGRRNLRRTRPVSLRPRTYPQGHRLGAGHLRNARVDQSPRHSGRVVSDRRPRLGRLSHDLDDRPQDVDLLADPRRLVAAPLPALAPCLREDDILVPPRP